MRHETSVFSRLRTTPRWRLLLLMFAALLLFFIGSHFLRAGDYAGFSAVFGVSTADAAPVPRLLERHADAFYQAGLLAHSEAAVLAPNHAGAEPYRALIQTALENYGKALAVWTRLYEAIEPDDVSRSLERARLLDAINTVLWRMLPMLPANNKPSPTEVRKAIHENYITAFGLIEDFRNRQGSDARLAKVEEQATLHWELMRREQKEKKEKSEPSPGQAQDPQSQARQQMHAPDPEETEQAEQQAKKNKQAKKEADAALDNQQKREEEARGHGGTPGEQQEGPPRSGPSDPFRRVDGVPGLGQFALPDVRP